jgi:ABC-type sugar transport system substrate-binding protein
MMIGSVSGRRRLTTCLPLFIFLLALLAGCGGSSSSSTSTAAGTTSEEESGGSSSSALVKEAEAEVAKYTAPQKPIEVEPVAKPPEQGVDLALISCALPVCQTAIGGAEEAAQALGWSTKTYEDPLTPEGYKAAWEEALQGNPEGIVNIGIFPPEFIEKQLSEAKAKNIPVAVISPAGEEASKTGPVYATIHGVPVYELTGKLMADSVIADHGEGAQTLYVFDPTITATNGAALPVFEKLIEQSGGSTATLEVSAEQIGKQIPSQVVSYLQAHPEIEYVAFVVNDYTAGLAQAMASAGLSEKVKVVSRAPGKSQVKEFEDGQLFASVAEEDNSLGWRALDVLVKVLNGEDNYEANPVEFHQIINAENATELPFEKLGFYLTPGSPKAFLEAWGLSQK